MKTAVPVLLAVFALACGTVPEGPTPRSGSEAVESAIESPPATGLLVARVVEDSPAAAAGFRPGDVIVEYGGEATPDIPAINYAKKVSRGLPEIDVVALRDGARVTLSLAPGRMGVQLLPIVKGEGRRRLPPRSGVRFDFSALPGEGRDDWYAFHRDDGKCGFGRITLRVVGDRLWVMSEEILDPGTGLQDHEVTSVITMAPEPVIRMTCFRDRMNDWVRFGYRERNSEGEGVWRVVARGPGAPGEPFVRVLTDDAIPAYAMETLAGLMPREAGHCFRFLPVYEASGETGLEGALCGHGPDESRGEGYVRYEWRDLSGAAFGIYWVGPDGRVRIADYGDVRAVHGTKEEVLAGQPEEIRARIAR